MRTFTVTGRNPVYVQSVAKCTNTCPPKTKQTFAHGRTIRRRSPSECGSNFLQQGALLADRRAPAAGGNSCELGPCLRRLASIEATSGLGCSVCELDTFGNSIL